MGLRIVTKDLKCGTIRVVLRNFTLEGILCIQGIIKKQLAAMGLTGEETILIHFLL